MTLVFFIVLIAVILIGLLFVAALKVIFVLNTDKEEIDLTLLWLYPLIKAVITSKTDTPLLTVYLFNRTILQRELKARKPRESRKKMDKMALIRRVNPKDIDIQASYGFRDPSVTGLTCGAINVASQFLHADSVAQIPDFMAEKDYVLINATAKLNIGSTLVNIARVYFANPEKQY